MSEIANIDLDKSFSGTATGPSLHRRELLARGGMLAAGSVFGGLIGGLAARVLFPSYPKPPPVDYVAIQAEIAARENAQMVADAYTRDFNAVIKAGGFIPGVPILKGTVWSVFHPRETAYRYPMLLHGINERQAYGPGMYLGMLRGNRDDGSLVVGVQPLLPEDTVVLDDPNQPQDFVDVQVQWSTLDLATNSRQYVLWAVDAVGRAQYQICDRAP
jgi:hypothetical protein